MSSTPFLRMPTDGAYNGGEQATALSPKEELDQIAVSSGVPANVILAMAEQDKVQSPDEILAVAKKAAAELGPRIKAGEPVEKVIRERFADPKQADAFINLAFDIADQYYPPKQADQPKGEGGMGAALSSGIDSLQQGYGSAVEGIGKVTGIESVEKYGRDVAERNAKEADENGQGLTQWDEIDGVGSAAKYAGEVAAQNAPQLGLSIGGGIAGAAAGAAVAGPPGAVVGGVLGGMGVNLPLFYGQNRERQKQSVDAGIKDHVDEGAAFLAAIPQAALDSVVDRFMVGKFLKPSALKSGGILTRAAKNAATGVITEVPTEIGQQMIERAQAGLPLDSEDAIHEYAAAGIAAGILGGGVGGASGALNIGHGDAAPEDAPQDVSPPEAEIAPPKPAGALRKAIMNGIDEAPIPARQPLREAARQAPPNVSGVPEGSAIDLVMGDGTRIAATIVKEDPTKIVVANEQGEQIEIPRTEFDRGALSIEPRDGTGDVIDATDVPDQTQTQNDPAQGDNIAIPQQSGTEGLSPAAENALDHFSERSAIIEEGDQIPRQEAALRAAGETLGYIDTLAKTHGWDDSLTEVRDTLRKMVDDARMRDQADTQAESELSTAQPITDAPAPEVGTGAAPEPSPAPEVQPAPQTPPKTGEKPMGEAKPTKEGEVIEGAAKPTDEDYGAAFDQAFEETMGGEENQTTPPVKGETTPPVPEANQPEPQGVDYPNRKLNMRKAKADAPINGIGDNSPQSLGRVALANANEGDVIPGRGTVKKVTEKQIQIEKPDGKIERISEGSDKMHALARDVGDLIGSSANLGDEHLGNLMDMIERDPALVYRDGVPQLFDDPKEQANRGEGGRKKSILKPLSEKPADQEPVKKKAEEDQADTGQSSDQEKNAPTDPVKRALSDAVKRGEVEHTTKRGKKLTGYVVRDMKKAQANEIDKYSFKKNGGWFIRKDDLAKAHPDLVDTGTVIEETDPSEEELQAEADKKWINALENGVTEANKESTGFYSNSSYGITIDDMLDGDAKITITHSKSRYKGRAKVTNETTKTFVYSNIKDALSADVRARIEAEISTPGAGENTDTQPEQAAQIEDAAAQADPNPTDGQKEAGNYKMGHAAWNGLSLTIENAKGSERKGVDSDGEAWSVTMPAIYGYFKQTEGADGDHVDFYMGDAPDSDYVLIIDQAHADTAKFDEHKVIIGTKNLDEALAIYRGGFSDGKANDRISGYLETNVATLKALLDQGMMDKQLAPRDFPFKKKSDAKPQAKPAQAPTPGESAKALKGNLKEALKESGAALNELFGPKMDRLNSGFVFDEETYKKAVPHFKLAFRAYGRAATNLVDLAKGLINYMVQEMGLNREVIGSMRPYFMRFMKDVNEGKIDPYAEDAPAMDVDVKAMAGDFAKALANGEAFKTINVARRMASETLGRKLNTADHKAVEEAMELALVKTARERVQKGGNKGEVFQDLANLYERQPVLAQRTNDSERRQAYSTPAPLAYLASELAGIDRNTTVYEPTAGNGMLLIGANPKLTTANEIDGQRAARLADALGEDVTITVGSALELSGPNEVDIVIENPPFGKLLEENGATPQTFDVPFGKDGKTTEIDQAIAAKTLTAMTDDGKAVLIVGGHQGDAAARVKKYRGTPRAFWNWLYDNYNVTEHFTVSGDLYKRQGAGWPVDVVVIDGRGRSRKALPMAEAPSLYEGWPQLKERLDGTQSTLDPRGERDGGGLSEGGAGSEPDVAGVSDQAGVSDRAPDGEQPNGGEISGADDGGKPVGSGGNTAGASNPDGKPGERAGNAGGDVRGAAQQPGRPVDGQERTGTGSEPGGSSGVQQPNPDGLAGKGSRKPSERVNTEQATSLQVQYAPRSDAKFAVGTLVPKNMQTAMTNALDAIAEEVGDIDEFVAKELGYNTERMIYGDKDAPGYFSAEQVDALALSIHNVKNGAGFIIGDQTGVGKGRVVAAMMRWAERNDRIPVFLTARAGLFNAMVGDMRDIGWDGDPTSDTFVTDQKLRGKDKLDLDSGGVLEAQAPKAYKASMAALNAGNLPDGIKRIFTTYSQVQSVKGKETERRAMLRAIAPKALFILDESHLAGGVNANERVKADDDLSRGKFIRDVLDMSQGAFYSSATFAKSPSVMSLYGKTDLRLAVDDIENLGEVIERGGVPMQQVASNMLVQAGQYARRERSYAGVKFETQQYKTDMAAARGGSEAIRAVFDLDRDVMEDVRKAFIEERKNQGDGGALDNAVGDESASSIGFSSVMHNVVSQLLTAIKADHAADRVIEIIKSGRKPIIALSNTNESIITDFIGDAADGTEVGNVPFNTILDRYLDRLRRITVKDRNTEKKTHIYLTDKDIIRLGGKSALDQFNAAKKAIAEMKLDGIPGSPLDYILDKVEGAGYKMGEITGRQSSVRNGIVVRKTPSAAIKNRTMRAYNGGDIDALIINKSGAEGFSLHATDKTGNDGKPRSMIVLQPDPDINVFMQLIGRIHRTGQIHLPEYEIATSQLAVEKRPAAVLMRKMNSLSANTTANKDSVVELKTVDFMNKYGDQVMRRYLLENPDLAHALDLGSIMDSLEKTEDGQDGGSLVARVTGRMAVLDPDDADRILTEIEDNYTALIDELDRAGKNDLEAKTVDLDAKTESTSDITEGVPGSSSPFAQPARFEVADVKTFGKPMTTQEVLQAVNEAWGDAKDMRAWRRKAMDDIEGWVKPAEDKVQAQIDKRQERLADAPNESSRQRILDSISGLEDIKRSIRSKVNEIQSKVFDYAPGRPLTITMKDDPDTLLNGISLGVNYEKADGNPNAKSKMTVKIAIADPDRMITTNLSELTGEHSNYSITLFENMANTAKMFDDVPRETREKRGIITGNLIAGYEKFPKGRIVMFTRADGSIDQGILMPRNFNLAAELEKMPVPLPSEQNVLDFVSTNAGENGYSVYPVAKTTDGVVDITRNSGGRYIMRIRSKGGRKYTQHSVIADTIGELTKRGHKEYAATIYSDADAKKILSAFINDLGARFQAESYKPLARTVMGIKAPEAKPAKESRITPTPAANLRNVAAAVNDEIAKAGLDGKVSAKLVNGLTGAAGTPIQGRQRGAQIEISGQSPDAVGVLRHEIVHALRDADLWGKPYGLFTDGEWKALVRALRARKDITTKISEEYADLNASQRTEEGVAELYREWAAARDASGPVAKILAKVQSFLRAVASGLRGTGFNDAARVMEKIAGGEIGGRGPEVGPARDTKGRFTRELRIPPAFSKIKGEAARDKAEGNFISNLLTDIMGGKGDGTNILGLVPGEPLFAELGKNIPSAQRYLRLKHEMGAARNEIQARADEVLQDWRKVMSGKDGKEHNSALADLMHSATLAGLDPAARFTPPKRYNGEDKAQYDARVESRRSEHEALRERYNALPPEFRRIYRTVRDEYTKYADATEAAILKNIEKAMGINLARAERKFNDTRNRLIDDGIEGEAFVEAMDKAEKELRDAKIRFGWGKASRLQALRLKMESNRVPGPYFPLMRFGNYFVTVRERDSGRVVSFSKFESARKQKQYVAEMKKNPEYQVTAGVLDAPGQLRAQIDPNFVADVEQMIGNTTQDEALQDEIWQRYLETLPDFSLRKGRIHRKGTAGFSHDAFRVFGRQMFHGAHQLARLQYGLDMQKAIDDAKREADISSDPNRARLVANEMERRHEWTMNPKSSAWSTWATSAAFVYYLGATPAAAFVNLTQTTVVGIPILSAGIDGANIATATRQIARAAKDFIGGRAHVADSKSLSADEKAAMEEAYRRGTIDKSQSHDLAGIAESGVEYSDIRARIMKPISFLFHHTERANREVTFLAAYRMARNAGMPHEMAIDKATELTWKTHFNYESDARPRLLQQDWIRVAMVFKNYQINLLYRLFRDMHQIFNGASPEDRREARKQLIGITGMMMFHAGITGVWGYALLTTLLGMFSDGGSDEIEQEIKDAMVGLFGQDIGGALLKGVPGQLTGVDLTSRIGMPELWFRKPNRQLDGQQEYSYWVEQMLGAVPGMASRVWRGVGLISDGEIYRGVETAAPKAIRDIMKAGRYLSEGVTTSKGDPILEDVSPAQAIKQALGFTPAQISERYEMNSRRMNESNRIEDERSTIVGQIANNLRRGEPITPAMLDRMREFNAKHPTLPITAETIKRSVKSRIQSSQRIAQGGGVPINPKLAAEIDKKFGTMIYD